MTNPTPVGPPWTVDDIADVHAGVYPPPLTSQLRAAMLADPDAAAVLAALDSTVDQLSLLPPVTMPAQYADRLSSAITAEWDRLQNQATQVVRPDVAALLAAGAQAPMRAPQIPHATPQPMRPPSNQHGRPFQPGQEPGAVPLAPHLSQQAGPRQPVLPAVLPTHREQPAPAPAPVTDLSAARERSAGRTGPSSTRPHSGKSGSGKPGSRIGSLEAQRRKRRNWTTGLLAAAAVAATATIVAVNLNSGGGDNLAGTPTTGPNAADTTSVVVPAPNALKVDRGNLAAVFDDVKGSTARVGGLANPATWAACLDANKIGLSTVVGVSPVEFENNQAYAIAVDAGSGKTRMVVVGVDCGPNKPATLDDQTFTK